MDFTFTFSIIEAENSKEHVSPTNKDKIKITDNINEYPNERNRLTKLLLLSCTKNVVNVIIIFSSIETTVIFDVVQKVQDTNIPTSITLMLLKLNSEINRKYHRATCGVRDKTLIITLYGTRADAESCIKIYEKMIEEIVKFYKPSLEVIDAQKIIYDVIDQNKATESEYVSMHNAYGRVLLNNVYAKCYVPPYTTATKHGYAVIANDKSNIKRFPDPENKHCLKPGMCLYVKPGDPIPNGATAVVPFKNSKQLGHKFIPKFEDAEERPNVRGKGIYQIEIITHPTDGENINAIGSKVKLGDKILQKFTRIGLTELGLLASSGIDKVVVIKHHSIGIASIGNELQECGNILRPNNIYDGNRPALIALLKQKGFDTEISDLGIWEDEPLKVSRDILKTMEKVDIFVITGTANATNRLKSILKKQFNATIHFDGVKMELGKSTAYITCTYLKKEKHFLILVGNPASVLITAHLFLLPLLNQMHHNDKEEIILPTRAKIEHHNDQSYAKYVWGRLEWDPTETDIFAMVHMENKNSDLLKSANANAILKLPEYNLRAPYIFLSARFCNSQ